MYQEVTYKVNICVVNWGFLQAVVKNDENGMYQIAGKADVGERDPETQRQQVCNKT